MVLLRDPGKERRGCERLRVTPNEQQASFPASLALLELTVHSVFTCKQWETNTNKKPTSPYTAPAVLGHLVTTSLAKSRGECLSCQSRVLRGGEEGGNPIPYTHPQGRRAAKEYSTPPRHSRPSLTPATGLSPSHITEGKRFQMDGARRLWS